MSRSARFGSMHSSIFGRTTLARGNKCGTHLEYKLWQASGQLNPNICVSKTGPVFSFEESETTLEGAHNHTQGSQSLSILSSILENEDRRRRIKSKDSDRKRTHCSQAKLRSIDVRSEALQRFKLHAVRPQATPGVCIVCCPQLKELHLHVLPPSLRAIGVSDWKQSPVGNWIFTGQERVVA